MGTEQTREIKALYFEKEGDLVFCSNITELVKEFEIDDNEDDWKIFIDSSKISVKAVLLHKTNLYWKLRIQGVTFNYSTKFREGTNIYDWSARAKRNKFFS